MSHAAKFSAFGAVYAALGLWQGGLFGFVLAWLGVSFILVGRAYARNDVRAFGKRDDGALDGRLNPLLWPHLAFTWLSWWAYRRRAKEPCADRVAPGLWLGRRAYAEELPDGVDLVVDLTAEFPAPEGLARGRTYVCLPTLDGTAIESSALEGLLSRLAGWPGTVYIHCALGHGRSAMAMAALLVRRGLAPGVEEAVSLVKKARPGAALSPGQLRALRGL